VRSLIVLLACVLLPVLWLAALLAAPAAAFGGPASGLTYALGSLICHQRPERSFHIFGAQMPVCARCVGLYAGAATGAVVAIVAGWRRTSLARSESGRAAGPWRAALIASAIPTAATWIIEALGAAAPSNVTRAVAALPLGVAVAWVVVSAARGCHPEIAAHQPLENGLH
jgi:uncharacterized membrane protein